MATKVVATKLEPGSDGGTSGSQDTTGASILVVYVNWLTGQTEPVLSDSQGGHSNTYIGGTLRAGSHESSRIYRCVNPQYVGSGHTWSLTGTGNYPQASILALAPASPNTQFDAGKESGAAVESPGVVTLQPGSLTASAVNAVYVTGLGNVGTGASSINSSFTQEAAATSVYAGGTHLGISIAWKNVASPTATNPTWSWSGATLDDATSAMLVFLESVAGVWSVEDKPDKAIIPVDLGQTSATVAFAGTYDNTGTTPVTIEIQRYKSDGTTVLSAYAAFSSPTIAAGNWSASKQIPIGDGYRYAVRCKDGGGTVISTSSVTTHTWGVGDVLAWIATQSHVSRMEDYISSPGTPHASVRVLWADGTYRLPVGNGNIELGKAWAANRAGQGDGGTDHPLLILRTGIGGAGNTIDGGAATDFLDERDAYYTGKDWLTTSGALYPFPKYKALCALMLGGAVPTLFGMLGGSTDAVLGVSQATNYAAHGTIRNSVKTFHGGLSDAQMPLLVCINSTDQNAGDTDAGWRTCVQADLNSAANRTNAFFACCTTDLGKNDNYHLVPGPTGYERAGKRIAQTALFVRGYASTDGGNCRIASASRLSGSHKIRVTISAPGATALKNSSGSTTAGTLTGWVIFAADGVTPLTITATSFIGMGVDLTVSETMADSDPITISYLDGKDPTITNIVYDDTSPGGDSKGRPLMPSIDKVSVGVIYPQAFSHPSRLTYMRM